MKIAFVGKGGSGKTTLAALFARSLHADDAPVWAIDADINQHLAGALGAHATDPTGVVSLGERIDTLKEFLRRANPRIPSAEVMVKTTPPGVGSRLLRPMEPNLNHLVDGPDEYVVVDMTAGADAFASGLFTRFDLIVVVCEPTIRSVGVYRQFAAYAGEFGISVCTVGNKVSGPQDRSFVREHLGDTLIASLGLSKLVRLAERGVSRPIDELEPRNRTALAAIRRRLDATDRDWTRYTRHAVEFHLRNATAWANAGVGRDLADQIDPTFVLGPDALVP